MVKGTSNSFEKIVEMFKDQGADSVLVTGLDKDGIATGYPFDSKTQTDWSMAMMSDVEELVRCKYKKAVPDKFVPLYEKFEKKLKEKNG